MNKTQKAFTLMEIMAVIIIVGILAGFGMPQYTKAFDRANGRDAAANLRIIRSALILYRQEEGAWPSAGLLSDIDAINNTLGLAILPNNITYACVAGLKCKATVNSGAWAVHIDEPFTAEPYCGLGTCPAL